MSEKQGDQTCYNFITSLSEQLSRAQVTLHWVSDHTVPTVVQQYYTALNESHALFVLELTSNAFSETEAVYRQGIVEEATRFFHALWKYHDFVTSTTDYLATEAVSMIETIYSTSELATTTLYARRHFERTHARDIYFERLSELSEHQHTAVVDCMFESAQSLKVFSFTDAIIALHNDNVSSRYKSEVEVMATFGSQLLVLLRSSEHSFETIYCLHRLGVLYILSLEDLTASHYHSLLCAAAHFLSDVDATVREVIAREEGAAFQVIAPLSFNVPPPASPAPKPAVWIGLEVSDGVKAQLEGSEALAFFTESGAHLDRSGVLVIAAVGPSASSGLSRGDIITSINGTAVSDLEGFRRAMCCAAVGDTLTFHYRRRAHASAFETKVVCATGPDSWAPGQRREVRKVVTRTPAWTPESSHTATRINAKSPRPIKRG